MRILRFRSWATLDVLSEVVSYLDSRHRQFCSGFHHVPNMNPPVFLVLIPQHSDLGPLTSKVIVEPS